METMILVAGLAVAGLAGIAAAFYFSMRPGGSRVRAVGPDRATDSRAPASRRRTSPSSSGRSDRSASPARSARADRPTRSDRPARAAAFAEAGSGRGADHTGASTVIDFTGPQPVLDDSEPVVTGRRARHGDRANDTPVTPVTPGSDRRVPARHLAEADTDETDDSATSTRSRRRVGWRKGSDVDEELWPVEGFGGVSDEQFWDDMAADKPLATTARTAQPETSGRRRPPNAGPLPDLYPADGRSREDGRRAVTEGAGTHPQPRLGPDDRTAIQPAAQAGGTAPLATQPYPTAPQPSPTATQPVRAAQPVRATQPVRPTQPLRSAQPVHATQPVRSAQPPAGSRGRSRAAISADEDPLTSPAYSLRAKGSVDGRSRRPDPGRGRSDGYRSDPLRPDPLRTDPLRSDHLRPDPLRPGDGYGTNAPYPYPQQPYGEPASSASTPPYGEGFAYGNPAGQPHPAGDPRRANGGRGPGRANGNGAGDPGWGSQPGYPPVNGHRGPYDPRGYDRRLTTPR